MAENEHEVYERLRIASLTLAEAQFSFEDHMPVDATYESALNELVEATRVYWNLLGDLKRIRERAKLLDD